MKRRRKILPGIILLYCAIFYSTSSRSSNSPGEKLRRLERKLFEFTLETYPEFATTQGYHRYDDRLENLTLAAYQRKTTFYKSVLQAVKRLNVSLMDREERKDARILQAYVETYVNGSKWLNYSVVNPLDPGFWDTTWISKMNFKTARDFDIYIGRISKVEERIKSVIPLLKRAVDLNNTAFHTSLDSFSTKDMKSILLSRYYRPIKQSLYRSRVPSRLWTLISGKYRFLHMRISKMLDELIMFINDIYRPAARKQEGLFSLKDGQAFYMACLKWHLGFEMSPEDIHRIGVEEVARIEKRIYKILLHLNFTGDLQSFFKHLRHNPAMYNIDSNDIVKRYFEIVSKDIGPKMKTMFYDIPGNQVSILGIDEPGLIAVYANNTFYVGTYEPKQIARFTMRVLALHETSPGHHLQNLYTVAQDIPLYRKCRRVGPYYLVPMNEPYYTAFTEGWALYSESLGEELGLFNNPYDLFGRLCFEIFRACRLVIDTGIHAFGMSRDEAIVYLRKYTAMTYTQVVAEVDRYINWPGQAVAYKIGEMKIKALRQKAEEKLGSNFNIKEFHHQVLKSGQIPFDVLEDSINDWIQAHPGPAFGTATMVHHTTAMVLLHGFVWFSLWI